MRVMCPRFQPQNSLLATAAFLGLVLAFVAGCSNEPVAEASKPIAFPQGTIDEKLVGQWTADGGETILTFNADGSFGLKIDKTVDMQMGGGIQRIQREDIGRWTSHNGSIYIEHSDGLVLAYEIVPEDKPDEIHLVVKGQKKPVVYQRHTAAHPAPPDQPSATQPVE